MVSDRPKPMVMIGDRPFVDLVIAPFVRQGCRRVIFCTGYLGDHFPRWYEGRARSFEALFSREAAPLGTAGALAQAAGLIRSAACLVANGDSLCDIDPDRLLAFHDASGGCATVAVTPGGARTDVGFVTMDGNARITGFSEKQPGTAAACHNAGIYVFDRPLLEQLPATRPYSIETDWLPTLLPRGVYGFACRAPLHDIGTPERLARFLAQDAPAVGAS